MNEQDQDLHIKSLEQEQASMKQKLNEAGIPGFGPVAPQGGGSNAVPGVPVTGTGATLPWNAQGGESGRFAFQGDVDYIIQPPAGWSGKRMLSVSQIAPQYETVSIWIDDDKEAAYPNATGGEFPIYFENGVARTVKLRPYVPPQFGYKGSGYVQLVGGDHPQ